MNKESACRRNPFRRQFFFDRAARILSCGAGFVSLATLAAIFVFLAVLSLPLFTQGQWGQILSSTWRPYQGLYGVLPMVAGSLALSLSAFALAFPLGIGVCLFICGPWGGVLRRSTLAVVTFMTAIPTVVYGFVSVFLLIPLVKKVLGGSGPSLLAAGLTLALLVLPTVVLFLHETMREAEARTRLASASLGFSPLQALLLVVLPASGAGLRAAGIMGYCRALSDTLIPLMLAGNAPQFPDSFFDSVRTLTAHIALVVATDNSSPAFHSLFACGLILFAVSLAVQGAIRMGGKVRPIEGWRLALLAFLAARPWCRALVFAWSALSSAVVLGAIGALLGFLLARSLPVLDLRLFFGDAPALAAILGREPIWDGLFAACAGTMVLVVLASLIAIPVGIGGGVALSQYLHGPWGRALRFSANALAGVPSIVMGLFGFSLIIFLRHTVAPEANTCLLLSASCIALLVLPYTVNATAQTLESLPEDLRLLGPSLGMTSWQSLRRILLPAASRGMLGGVVLSMGRAAEDTAVILLTGVVATGGLPRGLFEKFEALPFTIYYLAAQYQSRADLNKGFGAALTLLGLTVLLFGCARALQAGMERTWRR